MCDVAPSVSEEDELYEELMCETNLVYLAVGDELVEVEKYSRKPLRYSMLHSRKVHTTAHVFVFDCLNMRTQVSVGVRVRVRVRVRVSGIRVRVRVWVCKFFTLK